MAMRVRLGMEALDFVALEYEQLKEEQRLRIGTRDNLLYATLGSQAVIAVTTLQTAEVRLLLLVAPVCVVLGWTYFVNDNRITAIGRYIETVIATAVAARTGSQMPVLAWEQQHRSGRGRRSRKVWQATVDLLTFVASMFAALAVIVLAGPLSPTLTAVVGVETLAGVLLAYQIVAQAVREGGRLKT